MLVGLSNTINFVEKLNYKINSRMGMSVGLLFQAYSPGEIEVILKGRLGEWGRLFGEGVLGRIGVMVGRFSSDIRAALYLCEKSLGVVMEEAMGRGEEVLVGEEHVEGCVMPDPVGEMVRGLPVGWKVLLICLVEVGVGEGRGEDES